MPVVDFSEELSLVAVVELKGLVVRLDGIALCFPSFQATLEKLDSKELQGEGPIQDTSGGLIAGARTVNDRILFFGDQRRILNHFFWCEASRAGNDLPLGKQVERLTNIKNDDILM